MPNGYQRQDIHGGGFDLKFPHHENEIAQEEAYYGHKIAHTWMHNGFINVDNVKMSKSLGNVILANDYINLYGGNTVRYLLLNTHYRAPVNFSNDLVDTAKKDLEKMSSTYNKVSIAIQREQELPTDLLTKEDNELSAFVNALSDDLNTANALSEVYRELKESNILLRNKEKDIAQLSRKYQILKTMFNLLGLVFDEIKLSDEDKYLLNKFDEARANKDFVTADLLRAKLIDKKLL